jgi:hypothetical protein
MGNLPLGEPGGSQLGMAEDAVSRSGASGDPLVGVNAIAHGTNLSIRLSRVCVSGNRIRAESVPIHRSPALLPAPRYRGTAQMLAASSVSAGA